MREALSIFNRDVRPAKREEVARMYKWLGDLAPDTLKAFLDDYATLESDTARIALIARLDKYADTFSILE